MNTVGELREEHLNEYSDELVEFRSEITLTEFDDEKTLPYYFQIDITDSNNPTYSEGSINDGIKHEEANVLLTEGWEEYV